MKHAAYLLPLVLLTACQALTPGAAPPPAVAPASVPGELVMRFEPGTAEAAKAQIRQRLGVSRVYSVMEDGERWLLGGDASVDAAVSRLAGEPAVKFAQPNHVRSLSPLMAEEAAPDLSPKFRVLQTPSDPDYSKQWHLSRANFPEVWGVTKGKGITVAVIDSGVDPDHPDLKANLLPMIDEVVAMGNKDVLNQQSYNNKDGHGHGTHVCGIVGAVANNGVGISGAAPEVTILPIKVTTSTGDADDATISKGIVDAVDKGARVINLSIGGPEPSPILLDALNYAFNKNVAVVIAAGNDGRAVNYPAAYAGVISVGAITPTEKIASYSSHGKQLVMVAPGGGTPGRNEGEPIYSTTPTYPVYITMFERKTNNYGLLAGTSMAAPLVTATAALLLTQEPGLTPAQMRTRLAATATEGGAPGYDEYYGFGVLDVAAALSANVDDGRR